MTRYVLTREHLGNEKDAVSTEQIGRLPHVQILDQTGDRVILLEADPETIDRYRKKALRGWKVAPEVVYSAPWDDDPQWR